MTTRANTTGGPTRAVWTTLLGLCVLWSACGDAYSTQIPPQKIVTTMIMVDRDFARAGETFDLQVVIFTPETVNYVTNYDFGAGVDVLYFDSGLGTGCDSVDTSGIAVPDLFAPTKLFPVCISAIAQETVELGERTVSIEIQSNGTPIIARAEFYILPAFQ